MDFDPNDAGNRVLGDGCYDFEIVASEDCTSRLEGHEGEQQVKIVLKVYHDGGNMLLNQWLSPSKMWKVKQFAHCTGLVKQFEDGRIVAADCEGKAGKVEIKSYHDSKDIKRNSVYRYLESETSDAEVREQLKEFKATATSQSNMPDDPPF
jgi:hypothetical protein